MLGFAKLHLNTPQHLQHCNNVPWTFETYIEIFGHNAQKQTQQISTKPHTKYSDGGVMMWACNRTGISVTVENLQLKGKEESQGAAQSPVKLWQDLKRALHKLFATNLTQLIYCHKKN